MASLFRFASYNNSENTPNNQVNNSSTIAGTTMPDMGQSHNYNNMNMNMNMNIPVPLQNISMNMNMPPISKMPVNVGMNMNIGMNMNMGMSVPPMGYNLVSSSVPHNMKVGIPVTPANYTRNPPSAATNPFPSPNKLNTDNSNTMKIGLVGKLGYNEKDNYDGRSSTLSMTPNTQDKSPLSPMFYQRNNGVSSRSSGSRNISKGSTYPLTPQTLNSQQGQSPPSPSLYENRMGSTYSSRDSLKLQETHSGTRTGQDEVFDDDNDKNGGQDAERALYYEMSSKTYVYKSREEGREGLRNGTLVKPDTENESGNGANRKKKLTSSGNESDDDDDSDGKDDANNNPEHKESRANRSRNKRSRGGCLTCRQRKKRCCESKPICSECKRLNIKCRWPVPGSERKNKSKNQPHMSHDEVYHEVYGVIKVLRGVVDYKIEP